MRQARGKGASLTPMSTRCCRWSDLDGQRHAINQRWRSPFEPCGWHRTSEVRRASAGDLRSGGRRREVWSAGPGRNGSHQEWTRTALACAAEAKAPTSESASEVVFTTRLRGFIQRMSRYDIFETGHTHSRLSAVKSHRRARSSAPRHPVHLSIYPPGSSSTTRVHQCPPRSHLPPINGTHIAIVRHQSS